MKRLWSACIEWLLTSAVWVRVLVAVVAFGLNGVVFYWIFRWVGMRMLPAAMMSGVVTVSLLIHELGHLVMARHFGRNCALIFIPPIGAAVMVEEDADVPPNQREETITHLAGPLAGGAAGLLCWLIAWTVPEGFWQAGFLLAAWVGTLMNAFNLIPAWIMDGAVIRRTLKSGIPLRAKLLWLTFYTILFVGLSACVLFQSVEVWRHRRAVWQFLNLH